MGKVVEPQHDNPRFIILAVANDGNIRGSGVFNRLVECLVKSEPFGSFALDMNFRDVRYDIRGIG